MPWYFLAHTPAATHGYGVKTGAAAICFWQADSAGITLWLDLRNGGGPVSLGARTLTAATVVVQHTNGSAFDAARRLCRALCDKPLMPAQPVYGGNNWYYTYGDNFGAEEIVADSALMAELAPAGTKNRPWMVIDMGYGSQPDGAGPTPKTSPRFPDMPRLVERMKATGVRPGIWTRPLLTGEELPAAWNLPGSEKRHRPGQRILDPTIPEAMEKVREGMRTLRAWGFELIKHDFSTYDLLGRWGFEMGVQLTAPNWHFADRSRTNAEILRALYTELRAAAPGALQLGCNTVGHLGAGLFEIQRTGDDTSGREWERTRKMGVNTLAFRLPQHGAFFALDADCVPVTSAIPFPSTADWLRLVALSGTPLFVSADPKITKGPEKAALRHAFNSASQTLPPAEPLDWLETTSPARWRLAGAEQRFDWFPADGASPFAG